MKILFPLILWISFHITTFAQDNPNTVVPFVAYWEVGDTYQFRISKIKQEWGDGTMTKSDTIQYIANFEVIDYNEYSYTIKWAFESSVHNFVDIPQTVFHNTQNQALSEVIYTTTETGEFVGIENWEAFSSLMRSVFAESLNNLPEVSPKVRKKMMEAVQPFIEALSSKEGIELVILGELQEIHMPFGYEFDTGYPIDYEDEIPNLMGGKALKADARLYFESVDTNRAYCVMVNESRIRPEETKAFITKLFKSMGVKNKEMKKVLKDARFEINDLNRYEYFYYPGVPVYIETMRETLFDLAGERGKSVKKTIIELIDTGTTEISEK